VGAVARFRQVLSAWLHFGQGGSWDRGAVGYLRRALQRAGLVGRTRDLAQLHQILIERGLAVRLGDPFPDGGRTPVDELPQVVARVRELLG
jgi:hypothetical protein